MKSFETISGLARHIESKINSSTLKEENVTETCIAETLKKLVALGVLQAKIFTDYFVTPNRKELFEGIIVKPSHVRKGFIMSEELSEEEIIKITQKILDYEKFKKWVAGNTENEKNTSYLFCLREINQKGIEKAVKKIHESLKGKKHSRILKKFFSEKQIKLIKALRLEREEEQSPLEIVF